jgi:ribonuclease HI
MKSPLIIYTDGACSGKPGPGGWGVFIVDNDKQEFEFFGSEELTTNNRMEMMGAIKALEQLSEEGAEVEIHTDSAYLKNGITVWIHGWLKNNWKTSTKTPVKNQDLWEKLHKLMKKHTVKWQWVLGHVGVFGNERADALARNAVVRLKM